MIYEMVAGEIPFHGATTSHTIVQILEKDPAPLTKLAHVPGGVGTHRYEGDSEEARRALSNRERHADRSAQFEEAFRDGRGAGAHFATGDNARRRS